MPVHVRAVSLRGCQRFSSMTADARYAIADRELPRDSFFIFFTTVSLCIAECKAGEPGDFSLKVLDDPRLSRNIAIFVPEFNKFFVTEACGPIRARVAETCQLCRHRSSAGSIKVVVHGIEAIAAGLQRPYLISSRCEDINMPRPRAPFSNRKSCISSTTRPGRT